MSERKPTRGYVCSLSRGRPPSDCHFFWDKTSNTNKLWDVEPAQAFRSHLGCKSKKHRCDSIFLFCLQSMFACYPTSCLITITKAFFGFDAFLIAMSLRTTPEPATRPVFSERQLQMLARKRDRFPFFAFPERHQKMFVSNPQDSESCQPECFHLHPNAVPLFSQSRPPELPQGSHKPGPRTEKQSR